MRYALGVLVIGCLYHVPLSGMASFNAYDPLPLFTAYDPHEFLQTSQIERRLGYEPEIRSERINLTVSPFGQWANFAETEQKEHVQLGDIHGTWNMLGMLYNSRDCVVPCAPDNTRAQNLYTELFNIPYCQAPFTFGQELALSDTFVQSTIGPNFGHISVPLRYRKTGVRGEFAIRVLGDLCIKLQVGFADIQQLLTPAKYVDLAHTDTVNIYGCPITLCAPDNTACFYQNVSNLMAHVTDEISVPRVTRLFGLDVHNFKKAGIEDLKLWAYVRHAFVFNEGSSGDPNDWPRFLLTPFAQVIGCIGVAEFKDINRALAVAFNNDGHDAIGFNTGVCLDFLDTIQATVEGGGSFFSQECRQLRVPTAHLQQGIFPCVAQVNYKPGNTWHLIGTLLARRFLGKLSAFVQFALLNHEEDDFKIRQGPCPPRFYPEILHNQSKWSMSLFNAAFYYDISPNITLGALWQVPLKRRNTPKCKTLIGSIIANF